MPQLLNCWRIFTRYRNHSFILPISTFTTSWLSPPERSDRRFCVRSNVTQLNPDIHPLFLPIYLPHRVFWFYYSSHEIVFSMRDSTYWNDLRFSFSQRCSQLFSSEQSNYNGVIVMSQASWKDKDKFVLTTYKL